jgi:hypothetical protein
MGENSCNLVTLIYNEIITFHLKQLFNFLVSNPLSFSSSSALHFLQLLFLCPPPFNRDDQQLLARGMASDFSVAWQFSQREQLV